MIRRVTLVGYRASGKSTVGRAVAQSLGIPFIDADAALEERLGCPVAEWFARSGEASFREREAACMADLFASDDAFVLATGGGAVVLPTSRELIRARGGIVVYLRAEAATLQRRLRADAGGRPSLTGATVADEVPAILAVREPWYRAVATHVVSASDSREVVAQRIVELVEA